MAGYVEATSPVARGNGGRSRERKARAVRAAEPLLYLLPSLTLIGVFVAYPMLRAVWLSLNEASLLGGISKFVGFKNYSSILFGAHFGTYALTSIEWTFGAVALQLTFGMLGALLLNQRIPLRGVVRGLAMIPWATPSVLVALIWLWLLDPNHGVINASLQNLGLISHPVTWLSGTKTALPTLIAVDTWQGVPFFAVMILAALQGVPAELRESARVDGCGPFGVFRHVVLPQILPTVLITVILRIIWTANYVDLAYILTGGGPGTATTTLPLQSYLTAYKGGDFGQGSAYAMVQALILTVFILIYVRLTGRREAS
jgi:multiple sugar transport system permease protein